MDLESLDKWEAYTEAKEEMFLRTDTDRAPWHTIKSNDKKRARVNALRLFLSLVDYDGKDEDVVLRPDPSLVRRGRESAGD
jgi:polyphosphate kinase 2 (PPK2 family)